MKFDIDEKSFYAAGRISALVLFVLYLVVSVLIGIDPIGFVFGPTMEKVSAASYVILNTWRTLFAVIGVCSIPFFLTLVFHIVRSTGVLTALRLFSLILLVAAGIIDAMNWMATLYSWNEGHAILRAYPGELPGPWDFKQSPDAYFIWSFGMQGFALALLILESWKTRVLPLAMRVWGLVLSLFLMAAPLMYMLRAGVTIGPVRLGLFMIVAGSCGAILGPVFIFHAHSLFKKHAGCE